jgi:hypothetical protein
MMRFMRDFRLVASLMVDWWVESGFKPFRKYIMPLLTELENSFWRDFYKYAAPTALGGAHDPATKLMIFVDS